MNFTFGQKDVLDISKLKLNVQNNLFDSPLPDVG